MKHSKFSRLQLSAAVLLSVFTLLFFSCVTPYEKSEITNQESEETPAETESSSVAQIFGTWESSQGEKYVISNTYYNNYSHYDSNYIEHPDEWFLYYSTDSVEVRKIDDNSGYVYAKFNDATHIGFGATLGQWYALLYTQLSDNTVKISQAYKSGGQAACDTLEEAVEEFTISNGYYAMYSECTKTGPAPAAASTSQNSGSENSDSGTGSAESVDNETSDSSSGDSGNAGTAIDKNNWTESFTSNNKTLTITATNGNLTFTFDSNTYEAPFWTRVRNMELSMPLEDERTEMDVDEAVWIATTQADKSPNVFYSSNWNPKSTKEQTSYDEVSDSGLVRWTEIQVVSAFSSYYISVTNASRYTYYYEDDYDEWEDYGDTNEILFNLILTQSQWENFIRYFR